jgi:hypothetical protein
MDNESKLRAPKAVRGYKTPNVNFRTVDNMQERSLNSLISPQKKGSCLNLKSQFNTEDNFLDFEREITNDFDEFSVKSEIFSILREGSTWCDSVNIRNSNPTGKIKDNFFNECFCEEFERKSSPLKIHNPIYKSIAEEFNSDEGNNISEFPIYNECKKID